MWQSIELILQYPSINKIANWYILLQMRKNGTIIPLEFPET